MLFVELITIYYFQKSFNKTLFASKTVKVFLRGFQRRCGNIVTSVLIFRLSIIYSPKTVSNISVRVLKLKIKKIRPCFLLEHGINLQKTCYFEF